MNSDSKTSERNPHSWNNRANLLYIDQPVFTGFSYDNITKGLYDVFTAKIYPNGDGAPSDGGRSLVAGNYGTQDPSQTLNTTHNVARVMWTFMQTWLAEPKFKDYRRDAIHLWSQS